jgi:hypothetical protein
MKSFRIKYIQNDNQSLWITLVMYFFIMLFVYLGTIDKIFFFFNLIIILIFGVLLMLSVFGVFSSELLVNVDIENIEFHWVNNPYYLKKKYDKKIKWNDVSVIKMSVNGNQKQVIERIRFINSDDKLIGILRRNAGFNDKDDFYEFAAFINSICDVKKRKGLKIWDIAILNKSKMINYLISNI